MLNRRTFVKSVAAGTAVLGGSGLGLTKGLAAGAEALVLNVPGNTLGVHVPYMAAINEVLPEQEQPAGIWHRVPKLQTITQSILAGAVDIGAGDAISTLRAVEAGADLKIIGNAFVHTSLVFVVNADKVQEPKDLEKSDVMIAVNSKGDFTHVMVVGPMTQAGVDMDNVSVIKMGGSGNRMRALMAGKVDGVPLHFDQAAELAATGNFKVLIEPAKFYDTFLGEVWITSGEWLKNADNRNRAKELLKATITAFRRTNRSPEWYAEMYRKYGTKDSMKTASAEEIEVVRQALGVDIGCWPDNGGHSKAVYEKLLPVYKSAGAINGSVDLDAVVDTSLVEEVLAEMN
ncbi:ABC transporter substrate-binding protein [Roseibium sediminicola]|uniref:ABC transporter substrate-binding protein n=1 Tax=Roseibium sediminicola TaxID=2933272 RepID=A0ABT0H3E2_9HYPH|nr:ABC transporter substrate-binding protein [Roseibium sp. CAU 1639]MCK7616171.1 ABC transporter substrate-binding protein [Roseibium sp. CAU 1639]